MKQKPPKNIIISHVYSSDNKGDAALTSVLIKDLKRQFPRATLRILTLESVKKNELFEGVLQRPAFMHYALNKYHHPLLKLGYTVYMTVATLLWAARFRQMYLPPELREITEIYANADLVVAVGGGYMRSRKGLVQRLNIPLLLHPLLLGHLLKKPTILYSQSVGPFQNRLEELMVAYTLKRTTLVMLREDISRVLLGRLGVTQNVVRSIDSGFLLQSAAALNIRKKYHLPTDKLIVGVTVRSWLNEKAQVAYERAVAGALDNIIETFGVQVIFIPQVTAAKGDDDRVASKRVYKYMHRRAAVTMINDDPDHHQIKAIYDEIDILLGTRFHSVIFSLTSYVPVLAIEYEHKTSGIMRELALEPWVIKIEDVTAHNLTELLGRLIRGQVEYRTHLREHLPPYVQKARETIELLEKSYYSATKTLGNDRVIKTQH